MAHKKGQGSTQNNRDSAGRRLGIKKFGSQFVRAGNIIVRQRGTKIHAGDNVGIGKDHTIFALIDGVVKFSQKSKLRKKVSVIAQSQAKLAQSTQTAKTAQDTKATPAKKPATKSVAKSSAKATKA